MKLYVHSDQDVYSSSGDWNTGISYDSWIRSDEADDQRNDFEDDLISIIKDKCPGCDIFRDYYTSGTECLTVFYDNEEYNLDLDFDDVMRDIFSDGPEDTAEDYAYKIINGIDPGFFLD